MPARPVTVLPNGYYLECPKDDQSEIVKRGGKVVVPAPIAAYAVFRDIVAGALGPAPPASRRLSDLPFTGGADTRYFILDTATGKLESNLDAAAWHARLEELGAPSDFEIYSPLSWQE